MLHMQLAGFELHEELGHGSMGVVYLATQKSNGHKVAVKFLGTEYVDTATSESSFSPDESRFARFENECGILQQLSHANIVSCLGSGCHCGRPFYVMEYVDAGSLDQLVRRTGPLSWREVAELGQQVAAALTHVHEEGVVHRDIKPSNLLVSTSGVVKLSDFGLAFDATRNQDDDAAKSLGTDNFMAPEVIRGKTGVTAKADLYSLGCALFTAMVGAAPFESTNIARLYHRHLQLTVPHLADCGVDCPPELNEIIQRLMAKDPNDRPADARAVQAAITDIVSASRSRWSLREADAREILIQRISGPENRISWLKVGLLVVGLSLVGLAVWSF